MTTTTNSTNTTRVQHPAPGARRRFAMALGAAALPLLGAGAIVAMRSPDPTTNSAAMPAATVAATPAPSVIRATSTGDFDLQFAIDRCIDLMVTAAAKGMAADCASGAISVPPRADAPLPIDVAILRLEACLAVDPAIGC